MRRLGKLISLGLAWAAVGLTMFAGVPHFICRCANGNVKPFCLGICGDAGCCCGTDACCSSADTAPRHRNGMASHQDKTQRKSCCGGHAPCTLTDCPSVGGTCCVRTMQHSDAPTLTSPSRADQIDPSGRAILPGQTPPAPRPMLSRSGWFLTGYVSHSLSPPPDLLAFLGHLLI